MAMLHTDDIPKAPMGGKELQKLRCKAGVSRPALAASAGYVPETIGRKERGQTEITIPETMFFQKVLGR